ncbi:MAG: hypothetical protein LBE12_02230 [Planctomycetaceae bacterium]|jgi:hypothetical protein|nr:hypothetical protein [Planctomycetaceae bacterium]
MNKKNSNLWRPTIIKQIERINIESSTNPVLVVTDEDEGYFKVLGNREGPHVLACEYVGTSLAKLIGLATFEYCIFHFSGQPEITFPNGSNAQIGNGFMTKKESGEIWDGSEKMLAKIINKDDITKLVCLDTWVRNKDRYYLQTNEYINCNLDNVFLSNESKNGLILKAFDFTHAFVHGRDITKNIIQDVKDNTIYGLFPEFNKFLKEDVARKTCEKLGKINKNCIEEIMTNIPREWEIESYVREVWIDFILQRAKYLSENFLLLIGLEKKTKQLKFDFNEE